MPLTTTEELKKYEGGELEIQNQAEGYLLRGEIQSAEVVDDELRVRFAWLAKGEGYPPLPERWVRENNLDYGLSLLEGFTSVSNLAPGRKGSGRLCIDSSVVSNELLVFFPPDGSKLDPAKIVDAEEATS